MAKTRSEGSAVGNSKFSDLNMTFYPTKIDNKTLGQDGHNPNLKGFWSAGDQELPVGQQPDYNMAEHVNALADAVIAVQRILGINPHVDSKGTNTTGTVATRIAAVENKDAYYDGRYGGVNWTPALGQTILAHRHGGAAQNQAPQIDLTSEVSGMLSKANINLTPSTGITGEDISVSSSVSTKISAAINDKLSITNGGTIQKDLEVKGRFSNRTYREWVSEDIRTGAPITAAGTLDSEARRYTGMSTANLINDALLNLLGGKYVLGVRLRVDNLIDDEVIKMGFHEYSQATSGWSTKSTTYVKGTDFAAVGKWQMFYLVFEHEPEDTTGHNLLQVVKEVTNAGVTLDFDCAWVMPIHPAVFDK